MDIARLAVLTITLFFLGGMFESHTGFIASIFHPEAIAHPGRLNSEGCHNVHKDWEYKSGRVVKAGTYHCHRTLGRMRLDSKEALQDPNDSGKEKKTEEKKPESWFEWFKWETF